jgi:hypothetical protein
MAYRSHIFTLLVLHYSVVYYYYNQVSYACLEDVRKLIYAEIGSVNEKQYANWLDQEWLP